MVSRITDMKKRPVDGGFTRTHVLIVIVALVLVSAAVVFAVSGDDDKQAGVVDADAAPTAVVNVAANADQWIVSDSGSGPGYDSSALAYPLNVNVYDPLIIIGSDYALEPGLATSWDAIPPGTTRSPQPAIHPPYTNAPDRPYKTTTWRFHLRQGVKFHDGSDFDADDVMWSWRDRQPINGAPLTTVTNTLGFTHKRSGTPDAFDSVEKVDQYTVDFTPKTENLRLPEQIGHPKGAIVPMTGPAAFGNIAGLSMPRTVGRHFDGSTDGLPAGTVISGADSPAAIPLVTGPAAGTGPFKLVSYSPTNPQGGGTAVTEANEAYWGTRAKVKRMSYRFIADATQRTNGLLSGQYDMAIDLDALAVSTVERSGGHAVTASYGQNALLYVNKVVKTTPSSAPDPATFGPDIPANYTYNIGTDPAVRQAISLAIDRKTYVDTVYDGNAAPGRWMGPPDILGRHQDDVVPLAFDRTRARTLLDDAGWTCGGGAAGAGKACGAGEIRVHVPGGIFGGRSLRLDLIGTPDVPQTGYDFLTAAMKDVGIDLHALRAQCNSTPCAGVARSSRYNSVFWDLDLELPNQNDANPAFLPTLRFACSKTNTLRFAPADGTNGLGPPVTDTAANGGGTFPFGNTPCATGAPNTTAPVLGPFDSIHVPGAENATTVDAARTAAAQQMKILVGQNQTSVVIPVTGQYRIYGLGKNFDLADPHPSQTSQRWVSLTKRS